MEKRYYPEDKKVRDWMAVAVLVADATWKHIVEWKKEYIGSALPENKRETEAHERGIQQASFLFLDIQKGEEIDPDDLQNAVTVFYLAALQVVRFLEGHGKGDWEPDGLRATAENLLEVSDEWYKAFGAGPKKAKAVAA